jgi:hypothetical protein
MMFWGRDTGPGRVLHRRVYMAGYLIFTSSGGDGVGPSPVLREISSSNPVNFTGSPQSGQALA